MPDYLKHHKELDEKGEGKCSVPMWAGGLPNGFCDKIAYGFPEGRNGGYDLLQHVLFLACPMHGGPKHNKMVASGEVGEVTMEKSVKDLLAEYFEYLDDRINKGEISFNRIQKMTLQIFAEWCDEKLANTHPLMENGEEKFWISMGMENQTPKIIEDKDAADSERNSGVEILEIPLEFLQDFRRDFEGSLRDIAGKS